MSTNIIIYVACVCLIFVIGRIFILPIKTICKLIINSIFGGILIWIINFIGSFSGFHIGLNFITIVCVGLLGIPGVILLIVLKLFLG